MSRLSSEDRDSELIKSGESFIRDDKSTSLTPSLTNSLSPAPSIHRSLPPSPSLPLPPSLCLSLSRRRCSSSRGPPPRRDFSNTLPLPPTVPTPSDPWVRRRIRTRARSRAMRERADVRIAVFGRFSVFRFKRTLPAGSFADKPETRPICCSWWGVGWGRGLGRRRI